MAVSRRSSRPRFVLLVLVLASLTLITLDVRGSGAIPGVRGRARDVFAPVQSAISSATQPVTDFFHGVFEYSQLRHDNARLRADLDQLRAQRIQTQYDEQQIKDLNDLLKLDFVGDIPTVAARVVGGPESNFQLTLVIDRGTSAGVLRGMPVVSGSGLVGRVISVAARQSTVLLLTDPAASVGIQLAPSPSVGVASGQGTGRSLDVTLIDPSQVVAAGAVAVTSGLASSPYPRGIPVGRASTGGGVGHRVTLDPVVDMTRLSYVDVLIWTPQTHPVATPDAGNVPVSTPPPPPTSPSTSSPSSTVKK